MDKQAAAEAACASLGHHAPSCLLAFSSAPEPLLGPMLSEVLEATPEGTPLAGKASVVSLRRRGVNLE